MREFLISDNLMMLLPFIITTLGGFYLLFADLFKDSAALRKILFVLSLVFASLSIASFYPYTRIAKQFFFSNALFLTDPLSAFVNIAVLSVLIMTLVVSRDFLARSRARHGEYYSLLFFSALGMIILSSSSNLLMVFLGLEIMSIPLYILSGFLRDEARSREAALKYFILGAFSTGLLAMGIAFVFGATGTLDIRQALSAGTSPCSSSTLLLAGLGLIMIGLGFKLAFVPFHMWAPDVYEGAPSTIVGFMSTAVKLATFTVFARIFIFDPGMVSADLTLVLKILAIASMTLGNFAALNQKSVKRMLAYSSIAHSGYMLIAVIASREAVAARLGLSALMFYLVAYSMMKLGAFSVVSYLDEKDGKGTMLDDYCELGSRRPFMALAMTVFLFSLAGIPLTAGFMGKLYVFGAAVKSGNLDLAIIGVINSLISVYYYLRLIVNMYMKKSIDPAPSRPGFSTSLVCGITMLGVLLFGIFPGILVKVTDFIAYVML